MPTSINPSKKQASLLNYELIKKWPFEPLTEAYSREDVITYAKGIGVGMPGPLQAEEDQFLCNDDALKVLPMMSVIMNQGPMWTQDPRAGIDWTKTVHVEEAITLLKEIPNQGVLIANYQVDEIYDKGEGRGALMYEEKSLCDAGGELLAHVNITTYLRANGGFGGPKGGKSNSRKMPDNREADAVIDLATPSSDNTTYQLGAEFIEAVKSELMTASTPMLRGVCSFGIAGRALLKLTCNNQTERLKHLGLSYIAPVFADETLRTEVWFKEPGIALFRVTCLERDCVVMDKGYAEFITD